MTKLFNLYVKIISGIIFDLLLLVTLFIISTRWYLQKTVSDNLLYFAYPVLLLMLMNNSLGIYAKVNTTSIKELKIREIFSVLLSVVSVYILLIYTKLDQSDELKIFIALLGSVFVMWIYRLFIFGRISQQYLRQRILVYGSGSRAVSVGQKLTSADARVDLVGYYTGLMEPIKEGHGEKILCPEKTLTEHVREQHVDEIVVALSERRGGSMPLRELLECKLSGVRVVDMATHFEKKLGKLSQDYVSVGSLIFSDGFRQGAVRKGVKRFFDILFSLVLIVFTLPLLVISGLIILFESGFPILYAQERVGLNGRLFSVYKLRSMKNGAEAEGQAIWALHKDDRVTRFGRIIRKFRIDELPQLFSVLSGTMSLVGPRPERPYFVEKLTQELPFYAVRLSVKPGITGWAQVKYHYASTLADSAEKLQYDLYYVKNNAILLDFIVIFKTVGVVLTGKGAH